MSDNENINIEKFRETLVEKKAELERLSEQSKEARDAVELDQTRQGRLSRQDALMQQEMAKETQRRREFELKRIEIAFEKMKNDDYGYCIQCDEIIAEKRLELDPAIPTCIKCAK